MTMIKDIDGILVVDATKPLTFEITPRDIRVSSKKDSSKCAAATACKRQYHVADVRIHLSRVYLRYARGPWKRYVTPKALYTEIVSFDRGGGFQPGIYKLRAPSPSQLIGQRRSQKRYGKTKRKMVTPHHVMANVRAAMGVKS